MTREEMVWLLACAVFVTTSCGTPHGSRQPNSGNRMALVPAAVGCFRLVLAASVSSRDSALLRPFARVHAESTSVSAAHPDLHVLDVVTAGASTDRSVTLWSVDSAADSVRWTVGNGYWAVQVVLALDSTRLEGYALMSPEGPPGNDQVIGKVVAVRVPCARSPND